MLFSDNVRRTTNSVVNGASQEDLASTSSDAVSEPLHGSCDAVSRPVHGSSDTDSELVHGSCDAVSESLHGSCDVVSRPVHGSSDTVSEPLHGSCDAVSRPIHGSSDTDSELVHGSCDAVSDPLHGSCDPVSESLHYSSDAVSESLNGSCDAVSEPVHSSQRQPSSCSTSLHSSTSSSTVVHQATCRIQKQCPVVNCSARVIHLPRHLRECHNWTSDSALTAVQKFDLRKKYCCRETVNKPVKCKDYHKPRQCPVDGCGAVVKRLPPHLKLCHGMLPGSSAFKDMLVKARRQVYHWKNFQKRRGMYALEVHVGKNQLKGYEKTGEFENVADTDQLEGDENVGEMEPVRDSSDTVSEAVHGLSSQPISLHSSTSSLAVHRALCRRQKQCPVVNCSAHVIHLPRHLRECHNWTSDSASSAVQKFGLRKRHYQRETVHKPVKCKDYHKPRQCPVDGCGTVVKRLPSHLKLCHQMLPGSSVFKDMLVKARRQSAYGKYFKEISHTDALEVRMDKNQSKGYEKTGELERVEDTDQLEGDENVEDDQVCEVPGAVSGMDSVGEPTHGSCDTLSEPNHGSSDTVSKVIHSSSDTVSGTDAVGENAAGVTAEDSTTLNVVTLPVLSEVCNVLHCLMICFV